MNEYDVKRLAEILALQAEIEGMKVENLTREQSNLAVAYDGVQFQYMAEQLRIVASKHNDQL